MNKGFIILHRRMLDWEWYDDKNTKILFIHLLLTVNWKDNKWRGKTIKRGEIITSRERLAKETLLSIQQIRSSLNKLKSTNEITIKTTTQYTHITINNYNEYQENNQQTNQQITNKQPTNNQQITTTKQSNKETKKQYNISSGLYVDSPQTDIYKNIHKTDTKKINEVNFLIGLFEKVNPSYKRLYANKTQRSALTRMIKEHGEERLQDILQKLPDIVTKPYAPKITTPVQLEKDFGKLIIFIKQNQTSNNLKRGGVYVIEE